MEFQSSFELTGYITEFLKTSKEFDTVLFQSSFELTGYITPSCFLIGFESEKFQSSFELTGYITI